MVTKTNPKDGVKFTAYVTKWATTQGILKCHGELTQDGKYFTTRFQRVFVLWNKDCFQTLEEAQARAVELAEAKVVSAEKAVNKALKKLGDFMAGNIPVKEYEV